MAFVSFASDSVVRLRAPLASDGHGNTTPDWAGAVTETTITGCSVQPGASVENLQNREGTLVRWAVYAPPGADVTSLDRVRYRGEVYRVDGEPAVWASPTGALDHVLILLAEWEG